MSHTTESPTGAGEMGRRVPPMPDVSSQNFGPAAGAPNEPISGRPAFSRVWSEARRDLLRKEFAGGVHSRATLDRMNALPGTTLTLKQMTSYAHRVLHICRPPGFNALTAPLTIGGLPTEPSPSNGVRRPLWPPMRTDATRAAYEAGKTSAEILDIANSLAGPRITSIQLAAAIQNFGWGMEIVPPAVITERADVDWMTAALWAEANAPRALLADSMAGKVALMNVARRKFGLPLFRISAR